VAIGDRTRNLWVRAQADNSFCYNALYLSDENGDGKVVAEEYVEFCRLRLEQRLQSQEGYTYDISSSTISSFVYLPSDLQSNFNTLACFCSRFEFIDTISDKSTCCVGDNAHLSVVSVGNSVGEEILNDEESMYMNLLCSFTNRAIDNVISTMEIMPTTPIPTALPTIAPNTVAPSTRPTTRPSMATVQPTATPITVSPTIRTTARPSMRTAQPTITPTIHPSISPTIAQTNASIVTPSMQPSMQPTITPSSTISSPTSVWPTIQSTTMPPASGVQPTNVTIKTSYSILVEEKQRMTVDYVFDIRNDCIEAMNSLASKVSAQLWYDEIQILKKSVFHDRLFVELPTAAQIEDTGFTSTPELIDKDFDSENANGDNDENDKIFVGGPCPTEMMFKEDGRQYNCLDVMASISLQVMIDNDLFEIGISADDVEDLYSDALEREIMRGQLAYIHENMLYNSTVIMATGQTVPTNANTTTTPQTKRPVRVGLIVGLVAGGLLLILILVHLCILRRRRRSHPADEKEIIGEEDLESKRVPLSGKPGKNQEGTFSTVTGSPDAGNDKTAASSVQSTVGRQQQQRTHNEHGGKNLLMNKTVPYFQTDTSPGSMVNVDDAKSTGGVSAESDAGWSEAYTSSMGSVSDDGVCDPDSPPGPGSPIRPPTLMSLSMGPTVADIDTSRFSPMKDSQIPIAVTPTTPTSPKSDTFIAPISPITPKSIQLLEETTSDDDDEILIHEDFSDEEGDDDNNDGKNESHYHHKQSSEDFRATVYAFVERICPEELDQIDDMISQFKNREGELIETLLAMERRASAQKQKGISSPPSSPSGKDLG
jgi:hypothetical protein